MDTSQPASFTHSASSRLPSTGLLVLNRFADGGPRSRIYIGDAYILELLNTRDGLVLLQLTAGMEARLVRLKPPQSRVAGPEQLDISPGLSVRIAAVRTTNQVKIGIRAPKSVAVLRGELVEPVTSLANPDGNTRQNTGGQ